MNTTNSSSNKGWSFFVLAALLAVTAAAAQVATDTLPIDTSGSITLAFDGATAEDIQANDESVAVPAD